MLTTVDTVTVNDAYVVAFFVRVQLQTLGCTLTTKLITLTTMLHTANTVTLYEKILDSRTSCCPHSHFVRTSTTRLSLSLYCFKITMLPMLHPQKESDNFIIDMLRCNHSNNNASHIHTL